MFSYRRAGFGLFLALGVSISTNSFAVQAGVAAGVTGDARIEGNERQKAEKIRSGGVILTNDTLLTGAGSRMQALLVDESALTLGPNSSLTIDRFVYDPNKGSGEVVANMLRGSLRFVSGRSAALSQPQFKIKTPVGVLGIRGTTAFILEQDKGQSFFMGLVGPGPENNAGLAPSKIEFSNEYGVQTVDKAGVGFLVEFNKAPGPLIPVPANISDLFTNKPREDGAARVGGGEGNKQGDGGEETAENKEGGEETAENKEGGEETADNQEGGQETSDNQEGGQETADNQEGGQETADNQEGGQENNPKASQQSAESTESSETAPSNVAADDNSNPSDGAATAGGASSIEPLGETGTSDATPSTEIALAPASNADLEAQAVSDTQIFATPATTTNLNPTEVSVAQVALAVPQDVDLDFFGNVGAEQLAGQSIDIVPPGLVEIGFQLDPFDNGLSGQVSEQASDLTNTITGNQTLIEFNLGARALIEFDWRKSNLVDIEGSLAGSDPRALLDPFLIEGSTSDLLDSQGLSIHPTIKLDTNCVVARCSEVILIDSFPDTGLYVVGMDLDNDNNPPGSIAANADDLFIRFNQGGTLKRTNRGGSRVLRGVTLLEISPPSTGLGNSWIGAQIDPATGAITPINQLVNLDDETVIVEGFPEITALINQLDNWDETVDQFIAAQTGQGAVDDAQNIVSANLDVDLGVQIEFNWNTSPIADYDGFVFGGDDIFGEDSFHLFKIAASSDMSFHPNINLDQDCFAANCSEVITISKLPENGLYGIGMLRPDVTSATSTAVSDDADNLTINIVQGGSLTRTTNGGSVVVGGTSLLSVKAPTTGQGNAWLAAKIETVSDANGTTSQVESISQIFDYNSTITVLDNEPELEVIANNLDSELDGVVSNLLSLQQSVNSVLDVTVRTFLEFDWTGSSINNLNAHLNGPDGNEGSFHVFHSNVGSLTSSPGAKYEGNCTGSCKTEVITIGTFNNNQNLENYKISLFNSDQFSEESSGGSASSSTLFSTNAADIVARINQGGTLQRASNGGFRIVNGLEIFQLTPANALGSGNTWIVANIDPVSGEVIPINELTSFSSEASVTGLVQPSSPGGGGS